ncbi:MAG: xanthine dehydrogenase family protein, partial [Sporichthyaceae bacterium]|nr:xanthine dehydrogenase family protein [Sporichthyaceae bacterium]
MTTKLFGEPVRRVEDAKLVTGTAHFLDDLGHDALGVAFVRSPHAHARVTDIDASGALEVAGLVAVYTYDDLLASDETDGTSVAEPLPLLIPHPTLHAPRTGYPLAREEVNHVGEPVVMVVAADRYVAEDAAERIHVIYQPLPPVVGVENARAADHAVHDDVTDNVAAYSLSEVGDLDTAMAAAPHRLVLDLEIERSASMPMEGKGVLARWDAAESSMRVYSSTQAATSVRAAVAAKLGLALSKVECITPMVGGGFGVKIMHPWPEEVLVPWAAKRLGHEVKWTEDRREHFVSSAHERGQIQWVEVGFDDDGRLLALDVKFWHDNGAYTPYGVIVPIITSTQLLGPYKPGAYRCEWWSLYTNTVIVTPYRGAGRPQGVFAMERTMDAIADRLGIDRAEVRARNFITPDEMPYDHHLTFQDGRPLIYDSGDFPASLDKLKKLVDWDGTLAMAAAARAEGRRVGVGLACYVEGTGVGPYEGAHVVVEPSGKVKVATGLTTQGQGHFTSFAQIAADELGVPLADVEVVTGDTRRFGYAVGTFASRAAVMSGNAVALASRKVRDKALRIAGEALEADPGDLEIVDGSVRVKGSPASAISLATVAVLSNPLRYAFDDASRAATQFAVGDTSGPPVDRGDEPGLEGTDYYSPTQSTFANGMHAVVVETDPQTAEIKILRYCVVHDCGTVINPMIVEGQVHGGVAQGVGGALYERMEYDDAGQ